MNCFGAKSPHFHGGFVSSQKKAGAWYSGRCGSDTSSPLSEVRAVEVKSNDGIEVQRWGSKGFSDGVGLLRLFILFG